MSSRLEQANERIVRIQEHLRWGVSRITAMRICHQGNHTTAEPRGLWRTRSKFRLEEMDSTDIDFYDSNTTGKLLFSVNECNGRSVQAFLDESDLHGWPSFRDGEVNWEHVRVLPITGEVVSVGGTHLGHCQPDRHGNRFCINLCSISGWPTVS